MSGTMKTDAQLTLGPVLFKWDAEKWRDFYFRIAEEAPVETVYVGEVVCSKRKPLLDPCVEEVVERLRKGGKTVVFSTLAQVSSPIDRKSITQVCALGKSLDIVVEANDISALWALGDRPHRIGPFVNVYNEEALSFVAQDGATHVCLPPDVPWDALQVLTREAARLSLPLEFQVYGRIPLALSARCYHARTYDRTRDSCKFVCEEDPDGMELRTMEGRPFLAVNGIQTLSHSCLNLVREMEALAEEGIRAFRLSPHDCDMVAVAQVFRDVLDGKISPDESLPLLEKTGLKAPFSNGFLHKERGFDWVDPTLSVVG